MSIARSIGYSFIEPMVKAGIGSNRIYNLLRQAGVGYRKQDVLNDIRVFSNRNKMSTQIEGLTGNRVVPTNYMTDTELRRPYKYRVYGEIHSWDFEEGTEVISQGSFYTDDLAKKEDWEESFKDQYRRSEKYPDLEIMSFHISGVDHNEGFGY